MSECIYLNRDYELLVITRWYDTVTRDTSISENWCDEADVKAERDSYEFKVFFYFLTEPSFTECKRAL